MNKRIIALILKILIGNMIIEINYYNKLIEKQYELKSKRATIIKFGSNVKHNKSIDMTS